MPVVVSPFKVQPLASTATIRTTRPEITILMTAGSTTYPATAGQITLSVSINYASAGAPTAIGFTIELPSGWSLVSADWAYGYWSVVV